MLHVNDWLLFEGLFVSKNHDLNGSCLNWTRKILSLVSNNIYMLIYSIAVYKAFSKQREYLFSNHDISSR